MQILVVSFFLFQEMPTTVIVAFYVFLFALQYVSGNVDAALFAFPVNVISLVAVLSLSTLFSIRYPDNSLVRFLRSAALSRFVIISLAVMSVAGGLLPPYVCFQSSVPFVAVFALLLLNLFLAVLHRLRSFTLRRDVSFVVLHTGLLFLLSGGFAGAPDVRKSTLFVSSVCPESMSVSEDGSVTTLPYALQLRGFVVEKDSVTGIPVTYMARLTTYEIGKTGLGDGVEKSVEVNNPLALSRTERLYLLDYEMPDADTVSRCRMLVVCQPWQYVMDAGLVILVAGLLLLLFTTGSGRREVSL